jgi:hypothetical protein
MTSWRSSSYAVLIPLKPFPFSLSSPSDFIVSIPFFLAGRNSHLKSSFNFIKYSLDSSSFHLLLCRFSHSLFHLSHWLSNNILLSCPVKHHLLSCQTSSPVLSNIILCSCPIKHHSSLLSYKRLCLSYRIQHLKILIHLATCCSYPFHSSKLVDPLFPKSSICRFQSQFLLHLQFHVLITFFC